MTYLLEHKIGQVCFSLDSPKDLFDVKYVRVEVPIFFMPCSESDGIKIASPVVTFSLSSFITLVHYH